MSSVKFLNQVKCGCLKGLLLGYGMYVCMYVYMYVCMYKEIYYMRVLTA